ncbi:MAG: RtcB family protein [Bacteroidota bacterium]
MKARELINIGIPKGDLLKIAQKVAVIAAQSGLGKTEIRNEIIELVNKPEDYRKDPIFKELAEAFIPKKQEFLKIGESAPWKLWGEDIEPEALKQMENAARLPVARAGALMPDAHVGYGLPIGGVLATENAVIPYAVGVDIACRMKLTVMDLPTELLKTHKKHLINVLETETKFGTGETWRNPRDHDVMSLDWGASSLTRQLKAKAQGQLGTSGSGNHFVEYGILKINSDDLGLKVGEYLALLSHSGSRGPGAMIAAHFSKLAKDFHPELPPELKNLAWLDMNRQSGAEYWYAMNLMGEFAAANHAVIHREMVRSLGAKVLLDVENHHNFAWKETHNGKEYIVHRKGATPAGKGVLGIIPGSMASPAFLVRGRGNAESLNSASHGAGRLMSRTKAKTMFTWSDVKKQLDEKGVTLLSAGIDEVPGVYKDIHKVMSYQQDLVDIIAQFDPKIVKMAPAGEKPED